jgi:hypothetical protein
VDCNGNVRVMATATRVARATATLTKRGMVTATATMVVGHKEGNDDGDKSNGNGKEGGSQGVCVRYLYLI